MVKINYIYNGEKNENCNFLEITEKNRIKLVKLINKFNEIDKDIEVNIVRFGQLKYEVDNDPRIQTKSSNDINSTYCSGKRFLPEELEVTFKNEKICYCCHNRDFKKTILTVFHELNHFRDPFDLGSYYIQFQIDQNKLSPETFLKCNIKIALNEFNAEYQVVKQLYSQDNLKEELINQAKGYLQRSFTTIIYNPFSLSNIDKIVQMFNVGFIRIFRFLGCWKGFYEIGDIFDLDIIWDQFILNFHYDIINPKIFKTIKSIIFKNQKDVKAIFEIFKIFFNEVFNLNL